MNDSEKLKTTEILIKKQYSKLVTFFLKNRFSGIKFKTYDLNDHSKFVIENLTSKNAFYLGAKLQHQLSDGFSLIWKPNIALD